MTCDNFVSSNPFKSHLDAKGFTMILTLSSYSKHLDSASVSVARVM